MADRDDIIIEDDNDYSGIAKWVPTTVVLEPGTHDWRYWRTAMIDILAWHAARFEYDPR